MITIIDPYYGTTIWPSMGWVRGFAHWHITRPVKNLDIENFHIVDVGAGAGSFTLVCKCIVPTAKVTAIEPSPSILPYLKENTKDLSNVEILPIAVSNSIHTSTLVVPYAWSEGEVMAETLYGDENSTGVEVDCYPLDDIVEWPVHVIKIDVEGHEARVIEGALETLTKYKPDLIVEIKKKNLGTRRDPRPILDFLEYVFVGKISQDYWYGHGSRRNET